MGEQENTAVEHEEVVVKVTKRYTKRKAVVDMKEVLWETTKITGVVSAGSLLFAAMTPRPFFYASNIGVWTFVTAFSYTCKFNSCCC